MLHCTLVITSIRHDTLNNNTDCELLHVWYARRLCLLQCLSVCTEWWWTVNQLTVFCQDLKPHKTFLTLASFAPLRHDQQSLNWHKCSEPAARFCLADRGRPVQSHCRLGRYTRVNFLELMEPKVSEANVCCVKTRNVQTQSSTYCYVTGWRRLVLWTTVTINRQSKGNARLLLGENISFGHPRCTDL